MSFISYFFNHKRTVDRMFQQLEALNETLEERRARVDLLNSQAEELEARIREIMSKYPDLNEEEALKKYFETLKSENDSLKSDIAIKKQTLASLERRLGIMNNLADLMSERRKLETQVQTLKDYKKEHIRPGDVLIAFYQQKDDFACCSPFVYYGDTEYTSCKDEDKPYEERKKYPGKRYKSLDGSRLIGFSYDMKITLITTELSGEDDINTSPSIWFTLADVCQEIGSDAYLKPFLSPQEINKVVRKFLDIYDYFYSLEEDKVILSLKKRRLDN